MAAETDYEAREKLLNALAGGASNSEAARVSGYSRKHVKDLLKRPDFAALVEERRQAMADAGGKTGSAAVGLRVLLEIAQDKEAPHAARVSAARALLGQDVPRTKAKGTAPDTPAAAPGVDPPDEGTVLKLLA